MDFPRIIYADISCLIKDIENKNVSYRKRIVRQDFYHKTFGQDWVHPCNIFLSSSLITKQNLVTVFHTVGLIVTFTMCMHATMSRVTDGYKTTHFESHTHSFILTSYKLLFGYNDG